MNKNIIEINNLKEMLSKTEELYSDRPAYKLRDKEDYKVYTHKEVREMVNALGTALTGMNLQGKRIAVIGENRFEWEIAYLAIVCGTGIVVPFDKSLPRNELKRLIERSEVEAIFYSKKYEDTLKELIMEGTGKLKHLISMDSKTHKNGIYSESELIEIGRVQLKNGNREFLDAEINSEGMNIMLFTSGTTSESKAVMLSHKNICTNLMDLATILDVDQTDNMLSFLPLHHVFECTVGFLFALYMGAQTSFCDGIRHIVENLNEYKVSVVALVPAIYENMYKTIIKKIEKDGMQEKIAKLEEEYKDKSIEEKKKAFKYIHDFFGGNVKMFITGAAAIDSKVVEKFRLWGVNLCQGYGLTETSPVIAIETKDAKKVGSTGKAVPHVEARIDDPDQDGMGELAVKGDSIMIGYYQNEEATKEVLKDGWFSTGDLAVIDEEGFITIKGRKKSVIVLKNGKNIFPEEMEALVNRIEGVTESLIYGKSNKKDKDDIKIYVKMVVNKETIKTAYKVKTDEEIEEALNGKIKEINKIMPAYKAIRGITLSEEPLIKTTTGKIKRQEEMKNLI